MFPNAVILHTMRDPMDTMFSCYKHKFDDNGLEWSLDAENLALQYALYLDIMNHFRRVLPGRVMDIRYEEVVIDHEEVVRDVIDRLGLDWDPVVLEYHMSNRTVQTHSMHRKYITYILLNSIILYKFQRVVETCLLANVHINCLNLYISCYNLH